MVNQGFKLLELPSLEARIGELVNEHRNLTEENLSPSAALAELLHEFQVIVIETGEFVRQPRAAYLTEEWRRIAAPAEEIDAPPALFSFLGIDAFAVHLNLTWL